MAQKSAKGVVLLDKRPGLTSHDAVQEVKRKLGIAKAGHTGTLDSGVTGLLIIGLGEATKAMPLMDRLDKTYEGIMHIHSELGRTEIEKKLPEFMGKITQLPPKKSAVKREPRERMVYLFDILGVRGKEAIFRVKCEAGTYVRKLVHDFGEALGCGAHMKELRRTEVGPFHVRNACKIDDLSEESVIPLEIFLQKLGIRKILITKEAEARARNGVHPRNEDIVKQDTGIVEGEPIVIYSEKGIIAMGKKEKEIFRIDRVFNV